VRRSTSWKTANWTAAITSSPQLPTSSTARTVGTNPTANAAAATNTPRNGRSKPWIITRRVLPAVRVNPVSA
jgi:hypothetical protein